jgi:hypothetical protein
MPVSKQPLEGVPEREKARKILEFSLIYDRIGVTKDFVLAGPVDFFLLVLVYALLNIKWTDWTVPHDTVWITAQVTKLIVFAGLKFQDTVNSRDVVVRVVTPQQLLMCKGVIYLTITTSATAMARQFDHNYNTNWDLVHSFQFTLFAVSFWNSCLRLFLWSFKAPPVD